MTTIYKVKQAKINRFKTLTKIINRVNKAIDMNSKAGECYVHVPYDGKVCSDKSARFLVQLLVEEGYTARTRNRRGCF
jgi:hypothetical protein